MPRPKGKAVRTSSYVDASYKGDKITFRSRTGFILFVNSAPIKWLSRKQRLVEISAFGAEFIAAKECVEALRGLRYKLRMMGIPILGSTFFYIDNMSVLKNISIPQSVLNRESNMIAYHFVWESSAAGEIMPAYVSTDLNLGDGMTKSISMGQKRRYIFRTLLYNLYDWLVNSVFKKFFFFFVFS